MRIHHLDCATLCPVARSLINGQGGLFERGELICHCLLIETPQHGLVLVDTGLGLADVADPVGRLGAAFNWLVKPRCDFRQCAAHAVERLGFSRADVRHIVLTHGDLDHAGGLPDFPEATVHLMQAERDAIAARATLQEKNRYRPHHFAHGPRWATYRAKPGSASARRRASQACLPRSC